ncbi:NAD(P)/FAD-dependent oxidoreductase [Afifella pfennigii]|uniref:NAD(P)/FAD-dependent oxidoreductase n=1 Tax=Afifella pfennigii TaxID=209897 RepID=UPI00047DDAFB|nr:FAD-dependent oxidoreductase [Afifella pfennigii]
MRGESKEVIVIGAGIVGLSCAIWLQRAGHHVRVIEREGPGAGTSFGPAGVLASASVDPVTGPDLPWKMPRLVLDPNAPLFLRWPYLPRALPFMLKSLKMCTRAKTEAIAAALAQLTRDSLEEHRALAEATGAERYVAASDYLYAYRHRAAFEAAEFGFALRRRHGFVWEELDEAALFEAEPLLGDHLRFGVRFPGHGYIRDPGAYLGALAADFQRRGGALVKAEATAIVHEDGKVAGVRAGGALLTCEAAVLAAGIWSAPLAQSLGARVPMESERGYHVELVEPSASLRAPVMITEGEFVATPMEGRIRLGGVVEFGGLSAPPDERIFDFILRLGRAALPTIAFAETRRWMGHRPAPVDSIPLIGELPGARGAFAAFGHHHLGLTAGPKTGRLVADLVSGRRPNIDMSPYRPDRSP